jgi:ribonuclease P protein component
MLNRRNRLTTGDQFKQVLRRGRKSRSDGGVITVNSGGVVGVVRFGFVVSKLVGGAVVRNRVKRRLRAAASTLVDSGVTADVVVRADPGSDKVTVVEWASQLSKALSREHTP